jgi:hypothetical protein
MSIKIELTDDQINDVVIEDLIAQHKHAECPLLARSILRVLNFYLDVEGANFDEEPTTYMYGELNNIRISINGQPLI